MESDNLLRVNSYYTCHQVLHSNILHADYIAFMCFVWLSEQRVSFALYIINRLVFIIQVESVYSAVRTESLYKADTFRP
jgi:hypothetical protein